jgi:hypothetical protein
MLSTQKVEGRLKEKLLKEKEGIKQDVPRGTVLSLFKDINNAGVVRS